MDYCLRCKKKTPTVGAATRTAKSGTLMRIGRCSICNAKKSSIIKRKVSGGDIQQALSRLPGLPWAKYSGEKHLPGGYAYCGPGTRLDLRLDEQGNPRGGEEPINRVDAACLKHDKAYRRSNDIRARQKADIDLIQDLNEIQNPTFGERVGRMATKAGMKAKIVFGGQLI